MQRIGGVPDLREFDGEVAQQYELGALPLFSGGGDFLLCKSQQANRRTIEKPERHTFCSLYLLKKGMQSMMIQGRERPK